MNLVKFEPTSVKTKTPQTTYVRLRGLPFFSKESDVRTFLKDVAVIAVTFFKKGGRPSGEAYVEVASKDDVTKAICHHKEEIEGRYIEIFTVSAAELSILQHTNVITDDGKIVRLRGLPFNASIEDIKEFMKGVDCVEVIVGRINGKPTGEAFVKVANRSQVSNALEKNRQYMGKRYVEVFRGSVEEMDSTRWQSDLPTGIPPVPLIYRPHGPQGDLFLRKKWMVSTGCATSYDLPIRSYGYNEVEDYPIPTRVYMRGVPFHCDSSEIEQFFDPLRCLEIKIGFNEEGRPSGDASVEFSTMSEAQEAMSRNKQHIRKRYVELFRSEDIPPPLRRVEFRTVQGGSVIPLMPLTGPGYANRGGVPRGYFDGSRVISAIPIRVDEGHSSNAVSIKPRLLPIVSNAWRSDPLLPNNSRKSWLY